MNYYLIWTDMGWLKTPTYNHAICSGIIDSYETINTTQNIRAAYRLDERQVKDCLTFLQKYGVASWAVEMKDDMLNDILQSLKH
jgi:hypothetical protein